METFVHSKQLREFRVTDAGGLNIGVAAGIYDAEGSYFAGSSSETCDDNSTNYVEFDRDTDSVSINTSGFNGGNYFALAEVTAVGGDITSITDKRTFVGGGGGGEISYDTPTVSNLTEEITKGGIKLGTFPFSWSGSTSSNGTFLDGEEKSWKFFRNGSTTGTASFDQGKIKIDVTVNTADNQNAQVAHSGIQIKLTPSKKYRLSVWAKATNYTANGGNCARLVLTELNSGGGTITTRTSTYSSANNTWEYLFVEFTTDAAIESCNVYLRTTYDNAETGTVWFRDVQLEEIFENTTNDVEHKSDAQLALEAVATTDYTSVVNTSTGGTKAFGAATRTKIGQQFLAKLKRFSGFTFQKAANQGTYTGDVTISIQTDSSDEPSGTEIARYSYSNAEWNALSISTDYYIDLPCILTGSTKYWIVFTSSTTDASNYARVVTDNVGNYTDGLFKGELTGTWSTISGDDLYFKIHDFRPTTEFYVRQHNTILNIKADQWGFLDGAVLDLKNRRYIYDQTENNLLFDVYDRPTQNYNSDTDRIRLRSSTGTEENIYIFKVNLGMPANNIELTTVSRGMKLFVSTDASTWTEIVDDGDIAGIKLKTKLDYEDTDIFYIKLEQTGTSAIDRYVESLRIEADLDTSAFPKIYNYRTNDDQEDEVNIILPDEATRVYYQESKYGFPALEFTDNSANYIHYEFLEWDTKGVSIEINDITTSSGSYQTISATSNPIINIKATLSQNKLYSEAKDIFYEEDHKGSLHQKVYINEKIQGLNYDVEDLQQKVNEIAEGVDTVIDTIEGDYIKKDGSVPFSGDQSMGSHKLTNLSAGSTNGDSVRYEQACRLADAQTIADIKTFSSIPVGPASDPTTDNQLSRKKYVDDQISAAGGLFGGDGSDGALNITSGVVNISLGVVKNYSSISITGTGVLSTNDNSVLPMLLNSQGNVTITSSASTAINLNGIFFASSEGSFTTLSKDTVTYGAVGNGGNGGDGGVGSGGGGGAKGWGGTTGVNKGYGGGGGGGGADCVGCHGGNGGGGGTPSGLGGAANTPVGDTGGISAGGGGSSDSTGDGGDAYGNDGEDAGGGGNGGGGGGGGAGGGNTNPCGAPLVMNIKGNFNGTGATLNTGGVNGDAGGAGGDGGSTPGVNNTGGGGGGGGSGGGGGADTLIKYTGTYIAPTFYLTKGSGGTGGLYGVRGVGGSGQDGNQGAVGVQGSRDGVATVTQIIDIF